MDDTTWKVAVCEGVFCRIVEVSDDHDPAEHACTVCGAKMKPVTSPKLVERIVALHLDIHPPVITGKHRLAAKKAKADTK